MLSKNLEKYSGPLTRRFIARITGTPWKGFITGALATLILQSSSLTTVMVVGMVNARILYLDQALGIIIGANVGTTITAQLLSFNLHKHALSLLFVGFLLILFPNNRAGYLGRIILSFSVVLLGFDILIKALVPLKDWQLFAFFLEQTGKNPWKGVTAGFITAALIQSSSAVIGITLALAKQGTISLSSAIALVIGADVGTCVTALIASIRTGITARKTALAHLWFNFLSVLIVAPFFNLFVTIAESTSHDISRQLANAHTLYNLLGALFLLPFIPLWVYLLENTFIKRIKR